MLPRSILRQRSASAFSKAAFSTTHVRNTGTLPATRDKVRTYHLAPPPLRIFRTNTDFFSQLLRDHLTTADPEVSKILEAVRPHTIHSLCLCLISLAGEKTPGRMHQLDCLRELHITICPRCAGLSDAKQVLGGLPWCTILRR